MRRRTRILAFLALLSLGGGLAVDRPWEGDAFERTAARIEPLAPELRTRRRELRRIRIASPEGETHLVLVDRQWVVEERGGHPADAERLIYLVDRLAAVTTRDVVSVNPERHALYGVTEEEGIHLEFFGPGGETLVHLLGGRMRRQETLEPSRVLLEFYLRRADAPEVVLAPGFLPPEVRPGAWIDGRLFRGMDWDRLFRLRREDLAGADSWELRREELSPEEAARSAGRVDHRWRLTEPAAAPADGAVADAWAAAFTEVDAEDVRAPVREADPVAAHGPVSDLFEAETREGRIFRLYLGRLETDGRRRAWREGRPWVYLLDPATVRQLRQPADAFLP